MLGAFAKDWVTAFRKRCQVTVPQQIRLDVDHEQLVFDEMQILTVHLLGELDEIIHGGVAP
ncbi:hypothetical protein D3C86_1801290 [compost metagenome]